MYLIWQLSASPHPAGVLYSKKAQNYLCKIWKILIFPNKLPRDCGRLKIYFVGIQCKIMRKWRLLWIIITDLVAKHVGCAAAAEAPASYGTFAKIRISTPHPRTVMDTLKRSTGLDHLYSFLIAWLELEISMDILARVFLMFCGESWGSQYIHVFCKLEILYKNWQVLCMKFDDSPQIVNRTENQVISKMQSR